MSESDRSEGEVVERRDVTDLSTNDEVEDAIDDMLGVPEDERPERNLAVPDDEATPQRDTADETDTEDDIRPEVKAHMEAAKEREEQAKPSANAEAGVTGGTEVTVSSPAEPDDWESFDFEGQEWTLDDAKPPEVRDVNGMKFLLREPEDDDEVLNELELAGDGDRWDQMYALVSLVVDRPQVTREKWEDMGFAARLSLGSAAADYLGLDEGFLEG